MKDSNKKPMTIDDLAVVMQSGFAKAKEDNETLAVKMAEGFNKVNQNHEDLAVMVSKGFEQTAKDIGELKTGLAEVKHDVAAVKSNVNNYLELSEKRYAELKQRDVILAQWIKLVADKTGVPIDLGSLEKV